ncbi:MAG TPA: hypothetical protein PKD79_00345 [Candidatus Doudnabacteria bacterium]|nr:hypothetical protein [Candidatus Doudnabacteria bacterium]
MIELICYECNGDGFSRFIIPGDPEFVLPSGAKVLHRSKTAICGGNYGCRQAIERLSQEALKIFSAQAFQYPKLLNELKRNISKSVTQFGNNAIVC